MKLAIREVQIADYFDAALPLMQENWQETGFEFALNPSRDAYIGYQASGLLFALGAFDGDEMVGYCICAVVPHSFNPAVIFCASESLFIKASHRQGTLSARLILEAERTAKQRGARFISWHTRAGTPLADAMLNHGYKAGDTIVMKEL